MKRSYNTNLYIITLCLSSLISLHASQTNTQNGKKKGSGQKSADIINTTVTTNVATPNDIIPNTSTKTSSEKTTSHQQNAHPLVIHATRILPKKTMASLQELLQGLPIYNQNKANQSAILPTDLQNLQASLAHFAQALGDKHPYIEKNASESKMNLDESAILNHIQVILKSLPWYTQHPKILTVSIDLHEFTKQLTTVYNQVKLEQQKKIKALASEKHKSSKFSDKVLTQSMIPTTNELSDDQKDMREDSDGTPINETLTETNRTAANNDVIAQNLSKKHVELVHVINKRGRVIGSYKRTEMKDGHHIGEFTSIQGKITLALEGGTKTPKFKGVGKKALGIIRNTNYSTEDITLYSYHNT